MNFTPKRLAIWLVAAGVAACGVGCSDDGGGSDETDAGSVVDSGTEDAGSMADAADDATSDAAELADSGTDAAADAGPSECVGNCRLVGARAEFDGNSVFFERAYYGLTSPAQSSSGEWQVYAEMYAGGVEGCPEEGSPTPDQTVILAGLPLPESREDGGQSVDEAAGFVVTFFDFDGVLTTEPIARATGEEATAIQGSVCTDCEGGDPDGWVAFDMNAPFSATDEIAGHVYATHCASLDSI